MANERKTGLGTWLFDRTTPPPKPPDEFGEQTPPPAPIERRAVEPKPARDFAPAPKRPLGSYRQAEPPREPLRDRCTLYLNADVNQHLDFVARVEQKQRSEIVTDLLRRHLPRYDVRQR